MTRKRAVMSSRQKKLKRIDCLEEDKESIVEESWQADDKTSIQKGKEGS